MCIYTYTHLHVYTHIYTCIHIHTYTYSEYILYTHTYIHTVNIHVYIDTHTRTHTHTLTYSNTGTPVSGLFILLNLFICVYFSLLYCLNYCRIKAVLHKVLYLVIEDLQLHVSPRLLWLFWLLCIYMYILKPSCQFQPKNLLGCHTKIL